MNDFIERFSQAALKESYSEVKKLLVELSNEIDKRINEPSGEIWIKEYFVAGYFLYLIKNNNENELKEYEELAEKINTILLIRISEFYREALLEELREDFEYKKVGRPHKFTDEMFNDTLERYNNGMKKKYAAEDTLKKFGLNPIEDRESYLKQMNGRYLSKKKKMSENVDEFEQRFNEVFAICFLPLINLINHKSYQHGFEKILTLEQIEGLATEVGLKSFIKIQQYTLFFSEQMKFKEENPN